jgi:hypothetical protein
MRLTVLLKTTILEKMLKLFSIQNLLLLLLLIKYLLIVKEKNVNGLIQTLDQLMQIQKGLFPFITQEKLPLDMPKLMMLSG